MFSASKWPFLWLPNKVRPFPFAFPEVPVAIVCLIPVAVVMTAQESPRPAFDSHTRRSRNS